MERNPRVGTGYDKIRWGESTERARRSQPQEDSERAQTTTRRVPEIIERPNAAGGQALEMNDYLTLSQLEECLDHQSSYIGCTGMPQQIRQHSFNEAAEAPLIAKHSTDTRPSQSYQEESERRIRSSYLADQTNPPVIDGVIHPAFRESALQTIPSIIVDEESPLIEQKTKTDQLAVPVPMVLKEKSNLNSSYASGVDMPASSADSPSEYYMATGIDEKAEEDTPRGLDPGFRRHEAYPKLEIEHNDDLASLLSLQSFADSGYESQIMANDETQVQDAADELISLLLIDPELQTLFEEAFQRSKARERFVSKFRMLLKICGTELKREAINTSHEAAAHLIQAKATYVATHIKKAYETGVSDVRDEVKSANLEAQLQRRYDASSDSDSEIEEPYEGTKLAPFSLKELKPFMTTSTAFANMRNAFRRMVYPDPLIAISSAIFREHESIKPHSVTVSSSATFHIRWDVGDYIRTELEYDSKLHDRKQLLESVLVVVGSASTAYATSAINYMRWRWPNSDCEILRIVHSTLTRTSNGEAVPVNISS